MRFERHREVSSRLEEASNESLGVTLNTKHMELYGMDQRMEQRALGQLFVEHHHVDER